MIICQNIHCLYIFTNESTLFESCCSTFLGNIKDAFVKNPDLTNLLFDDFFRNAILSSQVSHSRLSLFFKAKLTEIGFQPRASGIPIYILVASDIHLTCVQDDRSQFTFCELCACNF